MALAAVLSGCATSGSKAIRNARFNYNSAIVDTRNEQMLANLVRLKYRDPPYFLEVSSVSTQYVLGAGGSATVGGVGQAEVGGIGANVSYEERPTITYMPLKGDDFVDRMLSPVPMEAVVLLSQSGWRMDRIMRCCVQRMNGLWNAPTASGPTPHLVPEFEGFLEAAQLIEQLSRTRALELRYRSVRDGERTVVETLGPEGDRYLLSLRVHETPENAGDVARLRALLELSPGVNDFFLTANPTVRKPYELGILPRSLMGSMNYLAQAVEPPQRDYEAGRVNRTHHPDGTEFSWAELNDGLFRIRSSQDRPDNAFVRVRYRNAWFYIDDSDLTSKSTFNLLDQLFQLQAGDAGGAAPLLTLPLN